MYWVHCTRTATNLVYLGCCNSLLFKLGAKWQIETNITNYFEGMIFALYLGALIGLTAATKKNVLLLVADDFRNIQLFIHGQSCFFSYFLLLQAEPWSLWWGERSSVQLPSHDHSSPWQVAMITVVKAMMVLLIVDEGSRREAWSLTKPSAKHLCVDPVGRLFWPAGGGIIIILLKLWRFWLFDDKF